MCPQNNPGEGIGIIDNSPMANQVSVFDGLALVNGCSSNSQSHQMQPGSSQFGGSTSTAQQVRLVGMQIIRELLQKSGFSDDIIDAVMSSLRQCTHKQYNTYINQWIHFCGQQQVNPLYPSVRRVLKFLQGLFSKGLSYSALNTARSAISNLDVNAILNGNVKPVGQHPLVCRYLRIIFNQVKPVPKYSTILPVDKVLHYLKGLFPLQQLSMKDLTLKFVMLIALTTGTTGTTGQRCQTLTLLDVSEGNMQKDKDCYNFMLTDHVKQDRPGKVFGNLRLHKYLTPELCVYTTLQQYFTITSTLRGSTKFLIPYIRPVNAVTSSTIAHLIKAVLLQAGIDTLTFSAHSTRSAATSKAAASVPIDAIL